MPILKLRVFNFGFFSMFAVFLSFLPLYLSGKGLSQSEIGALLGVGGCIGVFSQPVWGIVSDRSKTIKKVLLPLIAVSLALGFLLFQSAGLPVLLAFTCLMYMFFMPSDPLIESLNYQSASRFGIPYGSVKMFGALGYATASLALGYATDRLGMGSVAYLFLGYGTVALLAGFVLQDAPASSKPLRMKDLGRFVSRREVLAFFLLVLVMAVPHRTNDTYIGLYIADRGGSLQIVGYAWFVMTISEVVCFALVHRVLRPGSELRLIAAAGVLYAVRFLLTAVCASPAAIMLLQAMQGVTFVLFYTAAVQYLYAVIPEEWKATGQTMLAVIFFGISGIVSSFAGGFLFDQAGGGNLYGMMACLSLAGAISFYALDRRGRQRAVCGESG